MNLTENTILITGAGTGIGLEAAKLFDERTNRLIGGDKTVCNTF